MTATPHDATAETPAKPTGRWSDMSRRLLTIAIGVPVVLAIVIVGSPLVEIALLLVANFVVIEIAHMIDQTSRRDAPWGIVALWLTWYGAYQARPIFFLIAAVIIIVPGTIRILFDRSITHNPESRTPRLRTWFTRYGALLFGVLYTGISFGLLSTVRYASNGLGWMIYILFITWSTDSFALLGGRWWGSRKLAPKISPNKTIEGASFGYLCGAVMGLAVALGAQLPLELALPGALLLPIFVICGDLLESWLKRYYEVKDSGSFLPGHGGFFDRVDGLMAAVPLMYIILKLGNIL
jgi:phosphatidate cytidylyltransferase